MLPVLGAALGLALGALAVLASDVLPGALLAPLLVAALALPLSARLFRRLPELKRRVDELEARLLELTERLGPSERTRS